MKQALRKVTVLSLTAFFVVLSFGIHDNLSLQAEHATGDTSHSSSSPSNCITFCTLATLHRDKLLNETDEEENDDKRQLPFYVRFQLSPLIVLKNEHSQKARSQIEREPPPDDTPAYIGLTVFRA